MMAPRPLVSDPENLHIDMLQQILMAPDRVVKQRLLHTHLVHTSTFFQLGSAQPGLVQTSPALCTDLGACVGKDSGALLCGHTELSDRGRSMTGRKPRIRSPASSSFSFCSLCVLGVRNLLTPPGSHSGALSGSYSTTGIIPGIRRTSAASQFASSCVAYQVGLLSIPRQRTCILQGLSLDIVPVFIGVNEISCFMDSGLDGLLGEMPCVCHSTS